MRHLVWDIQGPMLIFLPSAQDEQESIHYANVPGHSHLANSGGRDLDDLFTQQGRKCWLRLLLPMHSSKSQKQGTKEEALNRKVRERRKKPDTRSQTNLHMVCSAAWAHTTPSLLFNYQPSYRRPNTLLFLPPEWLPFHFYLVLLRCHQ